MPPLRFLKSFAELRTSSGSVLLHATPAPHLTSLIIRSSCLVSRSRDDDDEKNVWWRVENRRTGPFPFFFFFLDFLTTGTGDGQGAKVHKKNKNKYGRCAKVQPKKIWSVCQSSQKKIPKGAKVHKKKYPKVQNDHIATVDS